MQQLTIDFAAHHPRCKGDCKSISKSCSKCKAEYLRCWFSKCRKNQDGLQWQCKVCNKRHYVENRGRIEARTKRYRAENRGRIAARKKRYRSQARYNLTVEAQAQLHAESDGLCGITRFPLAVDDICVDHCHATLKNRSLVSHAANITLGLLGDCHPGEPTLLRCLRLLRYAAAHAHEGRTGLAEAVRAFLETVPGLTPELVSPGTFASVTEEYRRRKNNHARGHHAWFQKLGSVSETRAMVEGLYLAQREHCAILFEPMTYREALLEHCHEDNRLRGLVCRAANIALGSLGDCREGEDTLLKTIAMTLYASRWTLETPTIDVSPLVDLLPPGMRQDPYEALQDRLGYSNARANSTKKAKAVHQKYLAANPTKR